MNVVDGWRRVLAAAALVVVGIYVVRMCCSRLVLQLVLVVKPILAVPSQL